MANCVRPSKPVHWNDWPTDDNILDYVAGVVDTDGCIQTNEDKSCNSISLCVKVDQAEKGINMLYLLYEHFGGLIQQQMEATDKHQASFTWILFGEYAANFCKAMQTRLLLKKKQADAASLFPSDNIKVVPVIATNKKTNEKRTYDNTKMCAEVLGININYYGKDSVVKGDWEIFKSLTAQQVQEIKDARSEIKETLRELKKQPHDDIPSNFKPSNAYIAGLMDGDGCFDTFGKNGQKHGLKQKWRPVCDMLCRIYGGSVYKTLKDTYNWDVHTFAPQLIKDVAPYIVGKRKQVDLIIAMKPGEGAAVHAMLHDLKGKAQTRDPQSLTRIQKEKGRANVSDTDSAKSVKTLPKGVYEMKSKSGSKYKAVINMNKKMTTIGVFATAAEAESAYIAAKRKILEAKQAGKTLTYADLAMEKEEPNPPVSDEVRASLPSGIYITKANTFQVRSCRDNQIVQLGTHKTLDDAIKALGLF